MPPDELEDFQALWEQAQNHLMLDRHNARIDWFCGLAVEASIATTGRPLSVDGP